MESWGVLCKFFEALVKELLFAAPFSYLDQFSSKKSELINLANFYELAFLNLKRCSLFTFIWHEGNFAASFTHPDSLENARVHLKFVGSDAVRVKPSSDGCTNKMFLVYGRHFTV